MTQNEMMRGPAGGRLSEAAREQAQQQLLDPQGPAANVIGFGLGVKWTDGRPTGQPAMLVFVTSKIPEAGLSRRDVVPGRLDDGTLTDVVAIGHVAAQQRVLSPPDMEVFVRVPDTVLERRPTELPPERPAPMEAEPQLLARRMRPCPAGFSIGNVAITAGTLGSVVYDFLPGATTDPPAPGLGAPPRYYVLSNNHVLAASNAAPIGSSIVQPGPFDGGVDPRDRVATLSRFIPIQFAPQVPLDRHNNVVDAAIGQCEFSDATREVYFNGPPRAWRRKANVAVGDRVRKVGRTTNATYGRIISVDATVDVNYGSAGVARFHDQIITTAMSAGGDSGSLVTSYDNVAIGLLFAGSSQATILNHIETVRSLLRVEIAELLA
ncbi:serine protease [Dactylosporangium siamense]|uniref:Serine protease n=1 Tax=Dactylosporangium siamense TaxID=685454 RepID=A0A919PQ74_9ACTN|nr:serine protease [Dactylosporangium siamense]GIG48885.1 hypothetical protein Dsi01nite_069260 [Dactylosporangium siamense]